MSYMIYNQCGVKIRGADGQFHKFEGIMQTTKNVVKILFDDDTTMTVSRGHKFYINNTETLAEDLHVGDALDTINNIKRIIKSIDVTTIAQPVYSPVNVMPDHKYVTPNGVINGNCAFIGSTSTLINPDFLDKMKPIDPKTFKYGYSFKIWEMPVPGALYVLGVDSASGTGKDYAVIQVLRIYSRNKIEQVAVYADNTIDAEHFATVVADIDKFYNDAPLIIENNEIGKTVADKVWYECECGNIMNTDHNGKIGTRATKTSKLDACIELKRLIENNILTLVDADTIKQLSRFEEVQPNVFKGPSTGHDDLVSGLYWACYGAMQPQIDYDSLTLVKKKEDDEPPQTCFFESDEDVWRNDASMTDLWQYTSKMLNSIKNKILIESDDHLYYTLRTADTHTIIGTINKTYVNHVKTVDVQLRNKHIYLTAADNEKTILNKLTNMTTDIINEAMIIEIEEL